MAEHPEKKTRKIPEPTPKPGYKGRSVRKPEAEHNSNNMPATYQK